MFLTKAMTEKRLKVDICIIREMEVIEKMSSIE